MKRGEEVRRWKVERFRLKVDEGGVPLLVTNKSTLKVSGIPGQAFEVENKRTNEVKKFWLQDIAYETTQMEKVVYWEYVREDDVIKARVYNE